MYIVANFVVCIFLLANRKSLAGSVTESEQWSDKAVDRNLDQTQLHKNGHKTTELPKTVHFGFHSLRHKLNERGNRPLLSFMRPSIDQLIEASARGENISILSRSISKEANAERKQDRNSSKFSLTPGSYFAIIVLVSMALLVFLLAFMYMHQREDVPQVNDSHSHVSEAKQLLKNRLYVVKRYISYHFDAGLPCPEKNNSNSSSSSLSVSPNLGGSNWKQQQTRNCPQ